MVEWVPRSTTTPPPDARGQTGSHREIFEWVIGVESAPGTLSNAKTAPVLGRSAVADGSGLCV